MCGRYYIDDQVAQAIQKLVEEIGRSFQEPFPSGDIHPSDTAPVLIAGIQGMKPASCLWGFPGFDGKKVIFNARAETVLEKQMFCESVRYRRCIVPARHFYEWDGSKNKVTFVRNDAPVLYMAGFYDFRGGRNRFVILTTGANESMAPVHGRMPLILEPEQLESWVRDDGRTEELLRSRPGQLDKQYEYYQERMFP